MTTCKKSANIEDDFDVADASLLLFYSVARTRATYWIQQAYYFLFRRAILKKEGGCFKMHSVASFFIQLDQLKHYYALL